MSDPTPPIKDQNSTDDAERKEELEPKEPPVEPQQIAVPELHCYKCFKVLYEDHKSKKKGFFDQEKPMCEPCQGHYEVYAYQNQKTYRFLHPELFPVGKWEELISTPVVCITCTQHDFDENSKRQKDGKVHLDESERLCSTCNGFNCSDCVQHGKYSANGFVCMFCAFETPPECDIGFCEDCMKNLS